MPKPHVIVVADAADAQFFEQARHIDAPRLVHQLENPSGRRRTRDLASDRMGYRGKSSVYWLQSVPQQTDPLEVEEDRFAREIAQHMEKLVVEGRCSSFSLFTPPDLLGRLRKHLSRRVQARVIQEETADLTNLPTAQLVERLRENVAPRPVR